jgi:hypothetical protein
VHSSVHWQPGGGDLVVMFCATASQGLKYAVIRHSNKELCQANNNNANLMAQARPVSGRAAVDPVRAPGKIFSPSLVRKNKERTNDPSPSTHLMHDVIVRDL